MTPSRFIKAILHAVIPGVVIWMLLFWACGAWASTQPLFGSTGWGNLGNSGTGYRPIIGADNNGSYGTEIYSSTVMPSAGTISSFYVYSSAAPGSGNSFIFTLRHSTNGGSSFSNAGSPSPMTATISNAGTTANDTSNTITVAKGDLIDIAQTASGSPGATVQGYWSFVFTPTTANETILAGTTSNNALATSGKEYIAPSGSAYNFSTIHTTLFNNQIVMPTSGTIENLYAVVNIAPGGSASRKFAINQNGIDSSSLTATISGSATTANNTSNTVSVNAGDLITISTTAASTPAAAKAMGSFTFVPSTAGQFVMPLTNSAYTLPIGMTNWGPVVGATVPNGWNTQALTQEPAGVAFTAKAIYVAISVAPGASKSYAFTLYDKASATALTKTLTGTGSGDGVTTGNYSTDVPVSSGDMLTIGSTGSSGAASATGIVSILGGPIAGAAAPTFSPGTGTYNNNQSVTITCSTGGSTACYNTSGTATATIPGTCDQSTYSSPVAITTTGATLDAICTEVGYTNSTDTSATYTLTVATPTGTPLAGTYPPNTAVTLSTTTSGATICYTTDGSTPTASGGSCTHGSAYSIPVVVASSETIEAIATLANYNNSSVMSNLYTIRNAETFYVANAGSDSNNGTTTGTPWQTIAKVNASAFLPGDSILFNKGDTWNEELIVPSSGAAGNPITISSYGSGANPIFDESVQKTDWILTTGTTWQDTSGNAILGGMIRQVFQDNVRLRRATSLANCEATAGSWFNNGSNSTVYVNLTDGSNPNTAHVVAYPINTNSINFNGQSYITVTNISGKRTGIGVFAFGNVSGSSYITMQYLTGSQSGERVFDGGAFGTSASSYSNITIDHCTGFDAIMENVWVGYGSNITITNNEFYNSHKDCSKGYTNYAGGGILSSCGVSYVTIANNYIHDVYDADLMGIEWETGYGNNNTPTHVTISDNLLIDNQQHCTTANAVGLTGGDSTSILHNNIIEVTSGNCGTITSMGIQAGIGTSGPTSGVKVYSNTFLFACSTQQPMGASNSAYMDFENNIVVNTARDVMVWLQTNSPASTFKNNIYYYSGTSFYASVNGADKNTYAAWATASGETNGQVANPLFTNGSGSYSLVTDFMLQPGSPAIGAGVAVGLTTDYIGLPLKTPPDIGAYQFDAGFDF